MCSESGLPRSEVPLLWPVTPNPNNGFRYCTACMIELIFSVNVMSQIKEISGQFNYKCEWKIRLLRGKTLTPNLGRLM